MPRNSSLFQSASACRGRSIAALSLLVFLAGCTSQTGDFGRPQRGGWVEDLMVKGGEARSKIYNRLYSDFNGTDEEKLMRDKAWNLIRPPHATDWISTDLVDIVPATQNFGLHLLTETQRTRLTPVVDTAFDPKRYYKVLRSQKYASHHTRYDRVIADIQADRVAFASFIPTAEHVVKVDQERMAALSRLSDMNPQELKDTYARIDENKRFIGWVWRSIQYRMRAYANAIKRLEIETPSPKVLDANRELKMLYRDFKEQEGSWGADSQSDKPHPVRRSRYTKKQWAKEDPNLVK